MIEIQGQNIYISRGDNCSIGVRLRNRGIGRQRDYVMADREHLVFRLWDRCCHRIIGEIRSDNGSTAIAFPPEFTASLRGEYGYSLDIVFADGTKETVIGASPNGRAKFTVMEA